MPFSNNKFSALEFVLIYKLQQFWTCYFTTTIVVVAVVHVLRTNLYAKRFPGLRVTFFKFVLRVLMFCTEFSRYSEIYTDHFIVYFSPTIK